MIEFDGVRETYRPVLGSAVRAVGDFSLDVRAGDVLGLAKSNRKLAASIGRGTLLAGIAPARSALEQEFRVALGLHVLHHRALPA